MTDQFAAGMRRAAEECAHEEQLRIWAHDIIEGLGFADVLKISSYDDNIAAHEVMEAGIARVCQSLTDAILAAIPAHAPDEPNVALQADVARLREALTLIERLYYMEGKEVSWRASRMNAVAYDAQNGDDLAKYTRLFPRNAEDAP